MTDVQIEVGDLFANVEERTISGLLVTYGEVGNTNLGKFEIPKGTWARRMAGNRVEILPAELRLTIGVRDILVLHNLDDVPQQFGPILLMPGQTFRMPFSMPATYQFACTAHLSGQMSIVVEPNPATPWARLRWRVSTLLRSGRWS
jgi:hypothetical protein